MSSFTKDEIRKKFLKYWKSYGFESFVPLGIIPPDSWKCSLFTVSGLIAYAETAGNKGAFKESLAMIQPCLKLGTFRYGLDELLLRDGYFTFFEQMSCGGREDLGIAEFAALVWSFLCTEAGLDHERLHIGIAGEYENLRAVFAACGAKPENIFFPDNGAFRLDLKNELRGIYIPIYFDRGYDHPLSCRNPECTINCGCGRFLEVCDLGEIHCGNTAILDHGIGLERLESLMNDLSLVGDIDEFRLAKERIGKLGISTGSQPLIADHMKASMTLIAEGLNPGNKGRQYALRKLLRRIYWSLYKDAGCPAIRGLEASIPDLHELFEIGRIVRGSCIARIVGVISAEMDKTAEVFNRARKEISRLLIKKRAFADEDLAFLADTHGIPDEIALLISKKLTV